MLCLGVFDPPRLAPYHLKCPRIQSASPTLSPILIAHKIPIPGYLHISSWCDCPCDYIPYGRVLHTPAILMIGIANPLPKKSGPIWRCLSKNCKYAIWTNQHHCCISGSHSESIFCPTKIRWWCQWDVQMVIQQMAALTTTQSHLTDTTAVESTVSPIYQVEDLF